MLRYRLLGDLPLSLLGLGVTPLDHLLRVDLEKQDVAKGARESVGCLVVKFVDAVSDVLFMLTSNTAQMACSAMLVVVAFLRWELGLANDNLMELVGQAPQCAVGSLVDLGGLEAMGIETGQERTHGSIDATLLLEKAMSIEVGAWLSPPRCWWNRNDEIVTAQSFVMQKMGITAQSELAEVSSSFA